MYTHTHARADKSCHYMDVRVADNYAFLISVINGIIEPLRFSTYTHARARARARTHTHAHPPTPEPPPLRSLRSVPEGATLSAPFFSPSEYFNDTRGPDLTARVHSGPLQPTT